MVFLVNQIGYIRSPMDEMHLVERAKAGDFTAFAELMDSGKARVYGLALKLTGNRQDAEDIVQDSMLKAIDNIDRFRGESAFSTWLYRIALNIARSKYARQKDGELLPLEEYLPASGQHAGNMPARLFDWKNPADEMEQEELRQSVNKAVADLPYKYREAFILRYVEELPVKEIAKLTGESAAATKSRILRARLALRDRLSRMFEDRYEKRLPPIH